MAYFIRGQANTPKNPQLQLFIVSAMDKMLDCSVVGFRVLRIINVEDKYHYSRQDYEKIQVFPSRGVRYINTDSPFDAEVDPGHKMGTGHYYAPWTAGQALVPGEYAIIWEWKVNSDQPYRRTAQSFAVREA